MRPRVKQYIQLFNKKNKRRLDIEKMETLDVFMSDAEKDEVCEQLGHCPFH